MASNHRTRRWLPASIARPDQDIQYSRLLNPGYKLRKDRRGPQFDLEPFPILPHIFVPGQHPEKDPPRFYYGWPPNSDTLLDYAYSHKLSGTEPEITASDDDELYKSSSEEEGEDKDKKKKDGEDDGKGQEGMKHEAEANRSACSSGKQIGNRARDSLTVEELASPEEQVTGTQQDSQLGVAKQPRKGDDGLAMFAAIEDILINLGLARYKHLVNTGSTVMGPHHKGSSVLYIYTNYDLRHSLPTDDTINVMKNALGVGEGEARWYLSSSGGTWESKSGRRRWCW